MNNITLNKLGPVVGICLYFILFIFSASKYPGGSKINPDHIGFDWMHNLWCDLMAKESYIGLQNQARPIAIIAWISACISILFIFWKSVLRFYPTGIWSTVFKSTSVIAVIIGIFSFTDYHNLVVALCFPFGAITGIALTNGLLKSNMTFFKYSVWVPLLLLSASFFMYFTDIGLTYLGVVQKITLLITMVWLAGFYVSLFQVENHL